MFTYKRQVNFGWVCNELVGECNDNDGNDDNDNDDDDERVHTMKREFEKNKKKWL